jgi:hypothetical protein
MNTKALITIGMIVGSIGGSYIPTLWNADLFSMASMAGGMIGGFVGIWAGYKISKG